MPLTLEKRIERIESILGPPPFSPLHAITLESVRRSTQFVPANFVGGTAISVVEGEGNISTINHRIGNFGDLHTNYPETNKAETITGGWSFVGLALTANTPITFGGDVTLQRAAANVLALGSGDTFRSASYASGYTGWDIAADGSAEFNNIWVRGSIHSSVFVKDLIDTRAGTLVVAKSAGSTYDDFDLSTWVILVKDPPGGGFLFEVNDILRLKSESATGLLETWVEVYSRADVGDGLQSYILTYKSGSSSGIYPAGTPVVDYGVSGDGGLLMTAELNYAPYYDVFTHAGAPWTTTSLKVRLGNLAGITDVDLSPTGYGLYCTNVFLKGDLVAGGGNVEIVSEGLNIEFNPSGTAAGRIKFFDFTGAHDGYVVQYAFANDIPIIDAIWWVVEVIADDTAGSDVNALAAISTRGKGQDSVTSGGGTGLLLRSWQTPVATAAGAILRADDTQALLESQGTSQFAQVQVHPNGDILFHSRNSSGWKCQWKHYDSGNVVAQVDHLGRMGVDGLIVGYPTQTPTAEQVRIYRGTTLMGQLSTSDTNWLRINQNVAKNIYTLRGIRADAGLMAGNAGGFLAGCVQYSGNLRPYRNATQYTAYAFVPIMDGSTNPSFDGDTISADQTINLQSGWTTNIPAGAKAISVRLTINSATVGRYARLKARSSSRAGVSQSIQVAGQSSYSSGLVPTYNSDIYIDVGGAVAVWIDILGYWI